MRWSSNNASASIRVTVNQKLLMVAWITVVGKKKNTFTSFEKESWGDGTVDFWHPCYGSVLGRALFCQHGGFIRAFPLGVSGSAQLRSSGRFLLGARPAASRRRGRGLLLQPGPWPCQPPLLLLCPEPQSSTIQLQTQLGSVLPPTVTHQIHLLVQRPEK